MEKKIILIISIVATLIICAIGSYYIATYKQDEDIIAKDLSDEIVSTVILDINPSIKLELNKDEKIVNIIALNEDSKEVIPVNYKGKTLNTVVSNITDNLITKGYIKEDVVILLNTKGEISTDTVKEIIDTTLTEKEIEHNVIVPVITETAKDLAEEYNITESKASYLEDIIKDYPELKIEELKDKSIKEIETTTKEITEKIEQEKEEEKKQEEQKQQENKSSNSNQEKSTSKSNQSSTSCNPPTDLKDEAWCNFNTKRPQWCEYSYPEKNTSNYSEKIYNILGVSPFDTLGLYGTEVLYKGASYCYAYKGVVTTKEYRYTFLLDSVTGDLLEQSKEEIPKPTFSEDEALERGLSYFNLTKDDCLNCWVVYGTDGDGGPNFHYRYQVNMDLLDGTFHSINYNAITGEITGTR